MWNPYQVVRGRPPDFKVRYRFFSQAEGGRKMCPFQGYRSDLHYEGEDLKKDGIYMIHPEFLDADGAVILQNDVSVPESGEAFMWILIDATRESHRSRATIGRKCWFMEGSRKVAEATIIEQIGLRDEKL